MSICNWDRDRKGKTNEQNDKNNIGNNSSNLNQTENNNSPNQGDNINNIENIHVNIVQTNNQRNVTSEDRKLCQRELDNMIRTEIKLQKEIDLLKEENESLKKEQKELEDNIIKQFGTEGLN